MAYPTSPIAFTTKNTGDIIQSGDVNLPQTEIVSIETGLLSGFQHIIFPLTDATYDAGKPTLRFKNFYSDALQALDVASRSNYVTVTAAITGVGPTISTSGASDATINLLIGTKGGTQLKFIDVASLVNFLQYAGTATGSDPTLSVQGDANRGLILAPQGTGSFQIGSTSIFKVDGANQGRLSTGNVNRTRMLQSIVKVTNTTNQTVPNITYTSLTWNTDEYNPDGMHNTGVNPTRLTALVTGKYRITGLVSYSGSGIASSALTARFLANGGTGYNVFSAANGIDLTVLGVTEVTLSATQYVELQAYQNGGGVGTNAVAASFTYFAMAYIGE